ncbi:hypothetical protein KPH14_007040 [Odynerus spinipes]|uniref:WD repeat-containing protein 60 n=1 Tax=Odynerus spinipes TaxID=1348599 RepID=A0AAD9RT12_9HYME|nr:hypothetical protein KPH14_007040 [Odynerus spinipes]
MRGHSINLNYIKYLKATICFLIVTRTHFCARTIFTRIYATVSTKVTNTKDRIKLREASKVENHDQSKSKKISSRRKTDEEQLELTQTSSSSRVLENSSKQKKPSVPQKEVSANLQVSNRILKSKSSTSKSLSVSNTSERNIASYKGQDKNIKKSHVAHNGIETKPTKNYQSTYSEKRGLSTTYIPKSHATGHSSKQTGKITNATTSKIVSNNSESTDKNNQPSKIRRKSRTLSSSEVKVLHSIMHKENSSQDLPKNKIVTTNIIPKQESTNEDIDDNYYADDFEEYESDFEEYTDDEILEVSQSSSESETNLYKNPIELSTKEQQKVIHSVSNHKMEEEDMHDSGHYELAEAKRRAMMIESISTKAQTIPLPLSELQQVINKEYSEDKLFENKSLPLSMDEGFEDTKSGDFGKLPSLSQVALIDFSKTKDCNNKKLIVTERQTKTKSRGKQLLTMIKLNTVSFSLMECAPIPYEEFIRNYGKLHTQQIYTQTGDDRLEAETQTVEMLHINKWTQFPISCRRPKNNKDVNLFIMEQAGVGSDDNLSVENAVTMPSFDILQLNDFVHRAATVILSLLEERKFGGTIFQNDVEEVPISDGFVKFDIDSIEFLAGREVIMIHYSESINKVLLTIHAPYEEEIETLHKQRDITDYCLGCVWNICEPSLPTKLFYSSCPITACCFHSTNYNIVFAGLEDGSISLWDLKENEIWHHKVTNNINGDNWIIRTPTYTTTGNADVSTHDSKIVAIRVLSKIEEMDASKNKFISTQLCSIDENGRFIIWSMFYNLESNVNDLGLSQWGNIRLMKSQEMLIQLGNNGTIIDMHIDNVDSAGLFIATESSEILHTTCFGCKVNPLVYKRNKIAPCGNTTCIETCPFKASYFLVGCNDGTILLYSSNREKPILQLKHDKCTNKITVLQWSKLKPSTVYVLNNKSQIYAYNMQNDKIHYISTPSLTKWGHINCMRLCSWKTECDKVTQYLVLGTNIGTVLVYKLKKEFYCSEKTEMEQELYTFIEYIKLL